MFVNPLEFKTQSRGTSSGFTLLEVMIAMIVISLGIVVITNAWNGNFLRVRKSAVGQEVVHLLERKMLDVQMEYGHQMTAMPDEDDGDFGSDFPKYRWELKSREFEWNIEAQIGNIDNIPYAQMLKPVLTQIQEFSKKVIREVKVTVFAKAGKKEIPYSVTTYLVDYSQPMNIPALQGLAAMGGQQSGGTPGAATGTTPGAGGTPATGATGGTGGRF